MKCIILAAGYATRLYPLTKNFPKPLLKIGRKIILDWLVDDLSYNSDIDEFIIVTNHRFVKYFNQWRKQKSINITVIDDGTQTNESRLGAVNDIQLAADFIKSGKKAGKIMNYHDLNDNEGVFVIAGDNVLDFSLSEFVKFAQKKNVPCVMCYEENDLRRQNKTAIITFDNDGLITSYEEKPVIPKGNYAVPPFYYYRMCDIERIQEALLDGCGYDTPGSFAAWLSGKTSMYAYAMPGMRYDIGDIESYRMVQEMLKQH